MPVIIITLLLMLYGCSPLSYPCPSYQLTIESADSRFHENILLKQLRLYQIEHNNDGACPLVIKITHIKQEQLYEHFYTSSDYKLQNKYIKAEAALPKKNIKKNLIAYNKSLIIDDSLADDTTLELYNDLAMQISLFLSQN